MHKWRDGILIVVLGISFWHLAHLKGGVGAAPTLACGLCLLSSAIVLYFWKYRPMVVPVWGVIVLAIVWRCFFLSYPISDDVYRYCWEGKMAAEGQNPYIKAPAEYQDKFASDPIYQGINHKEYPSIYPPLAMTCFQILSSLCYSLKAYQLFFTLLDIANVLLLLLLLQKWRQPTQNLLLYAWNPLVLIYAGGEAHLDVLHLFWIALALLFWQKHNRACFLSLGAAVMTKYLSAILMPFLLNKKNFWQASWFFVPWLLVWPYLHPDMAQSLLKFSSQLHYNDFFPKILRAVWQQQEGYRIAMVGLCGGGILVVKRFFSQRPITALQWSWLWLLLCLPTSHSWYFLPAFWLAAVVPNWVILSFSLSLTATFWNLSHFYYSGEWIEFPWVWYVTYGVPLVVAIGYWLTSRQR